MYNAKNYKAQGGDELVIGGTLTVKPTATVTGLVDLAALPVAGSALGGVKAAAAGVGDTVECKIGAGDKLYVPALAEAGDELGGVKADDADGETDTVECKIGADGKLYVPALAEAGDELGGVKADDADGEADTVECKIGADGKLYVPAYPKAAVVAEAAAEDVSAAEFKALLDALKAAGLMSDA
jgi:hypothetical protein